MSIAIVGIGCIFPKAFGAKEFWQLLAQGRDGITDVPETHWSAEDYYHKDPKAPDHTYCKRGGFISPISYDPAEFGIPPNCLEATDTSQLLGLTVAKMALEDAGYGDTNGFNRERTSVILGVTGTQELVIPLSSRLGYPIWKKSLKDSGIPQEKTDEVISRISESYVPWQENSFPGLLGNVVPGRIANRLNLGGTNCAVDAACASSLSAVNLAILELLSNRCDMAVTGGVDTLNDIFMHMCFSQTGVLSHTGDAKPFSKDADGTVLGEGIGMVVLKRLEDAEKDKDRIYCVIRALGSSSDGRSGSIYAPNATGQGKALAKAYKEANIDPATVELVEAHGTGTRVGDAVEFKALANLFGKPGKNREKCALGSVKSNIGHTKAAAGAAGLIKAALSLHNKVIPPTLKVDAPDPDLHIDETAFYLNSEPIPWLGKEDHPRRSGVSAFGFGGSNFHVVLEEYGKKKNNVSWDTNIEIIALSGPDKKNIEDKLLHFIEIAKKNIEDENSCHQEISFDASESRRSFLHKDTYRLLLILDLQEKDPFRVFTDAMEAVNNKPEASFSTKNIFFGGPVSRNQASGKNGQPGKLAFVFPGQGSQYTGMGRNLACTFPEAQDIFEKAEMVFSDTNKAKDKRLSDFIYPLPFHLVDKKEAEKELQNTKVAQPAIGAVSLLMLKILERFGLKPDAVCGHSFGELTALCSARRIDEDTFHLLSAARGKFMAETGKKGSMLAVKAPLHELDSLIKESSLDVIVANRNSHEQGVLSGPTEDINKAKDLCAQKGFKSTILPVSAAFHSKLVKDAAAPFKALLDKVEIKSSDINVFSNTTAAPYPDDSSEAKAVLGNHLTSPVNFADEVENLFKQGITTFVEVGPKPVLTGLVKSILKGKEFNAICLDSSSGRKSGLRDLAATLCHIASLGHNVELGAWGGPVEKPRKKRMHMPISGANYRPSPKLKSKPVNSPNPESKPDSEGKPEIEQRIKPDLKQENRQDQTPKPEITPMIKEYNTPKEDSTSFEGIHKKAMDTKKPIQADFIIDALKVVQEGLKSMQELQTQTAEAHNKFLENQSQASRTMQTMMENAQRMAEAAMGASSAEFKIPEPISQTDFPAIKEQNDQKTYQEKSHTVRAEQLPEASIEKTSVPDSLAADFIETDNVQKSTIETSMLKVVSELTGYPVEMLDMDMDIEADLGIDSIKRVEILSAFEEEMPGLASVSPNIIGEMNTLGQITDYLLEINKSDAPAPMPKADNLKSSENSSAKIEEALLGVVSELTGYPVDMLDMDMDIEADLGIDSIKRVEILSAFEEKMPGLSSISPDIIGEMNTLGQIFNYLTGTVKDDADTLQPLPADDRTPHDIISGDIEENLLKVVSDLTGYPVDMLDMDMDIEADLGIDSIKRVEILSAFEEKMPDLPTLSPDVLGEIKTLGEIFSYLTDTIQAETIHKDKPSTKQDAPTVKSSVNKETLTDKKDSDEIVERNIVKMVEKPFTLNKEVSISNDRSVLIFGDKAGLGKAVAQELKSRKISSKFITPRVKDRTLKGAGGLIILPQTDNAAQDKTFNEKDELFLKNAFLLTSRTAPALMEAGKSKGAIFATVTRLDGCFGFKGEGVLHPLQGGLAGLAKTAAIEWEDVCCHAIDIAPCSDGNKAVAKAVVSEIFNQDPEGTVEVGLDINKTTRLRFVPELQSVPFPEGKVDINDKDVVVVTGGARGVTSACVLALAKHCKPTIVLLGRSPAPEPEHVWLEQLEDDASIKKAILANEFQKAKPTPVTLENSFKKHMANREISLTLENLKSAGSQVAYYQADVRDEESVVKIIDSVRSDHGPVKAIIHGAGVVEDRLIKDKTKKQFESVFTTKVSGLKTILHATREDDLKYIILFSSVSARMGNKGQSDYAMANETLNKIAQQESFLRKDCRVASINWGPWDGGMVSPSLKKEFAKNNIKLIPVEAGAKSMLSEMVGEKDSSPEVVIGSGFAQKKRKEDTKPYDQKASKKKKDSMSVLFKSEVNVDTYPILNSHKLNGIPVVPFALMTEWFGHGALHENPGMYLQGIDDMRLLSGIKLDDGERIIHLLAGKAKKNGSVFEVDVEIRNGNKNNVGLLHSRAKAILTDKLPSPPEFKRPQKADSKPYKRSVDEAYKDILFHGSNLHGIKEFVEYSPNSMVARILPAPQPDKWITNPHRSKWLGDPLVLDCAFQVATLWCYEETGKPSLPTYAKSYRQFRPNFPNEDITIVFEVKKLTDHKVEGDFTFLDLKDVVIASITGYEAVMDESLVKAFKPEGAR